MLDKELLKTLNIANSYVKNPKIYKNIMAAQKFNNNLFYLGLATLAATILIPILISILTSKGYL